MLLDYSNKSDWKSVRIGRSAAHSYVILELEILGCVIILFKSTDAMITWLKLDIL